MSSQGGDPETVESQPRRSRAAQKWWSKVVDVAEAKDQILFALPTILTNAAYYFIPLVSVMFAGNLGDLELFGSNLANSWASVSGFAFMVGLSGALETLCGQGFGAKRHRALGIYLQASCIITLIFAIVVSTLWWYSDIILTLLHQDRQIAKAAGLYLKYLIPGLFAHGLLQNILRFLQTQSVVMPLVVCSFVPLALHVGIAYTLVHRTPLAYRGAPLAASISLWLSLFMLVLYVFKAKKIEKTWEGFTSESLSYVYSNLKLALPSAAMVCMACWAFEILVLLAGLMPNPKISTSLIAICVNTEAICYMVAYGLSAAASTRVSNELGAGNPDRAKRAAVVTLKLTLVLELCVVSALCFGRNIWANAFSHSPVIIKAYSRCPYRSIPFKQSYQVFIESVNRSNRTEPYQNSVRADYRTGNSIRGGERMWLAAFGCFYCYRYFLFHWHAYCCSSWFQIQPTCQGIVDWINLWGISTDDRAIVAYQVHKMDKSRAISRFIISINSGRITVSFLFSFLINLVDHKLDVAVPRK